MGVISIQLGAVLARRARQFKYTERLKALEDCNSVYGAVFWSHKFIGFTIRLPKAMSNSRSCWFSANLARELWATPALAIGKRVWVANNDPWRQISECWAMSTLHVKPQRGLRLTL
jgi:hypothetical protein